MWERLLKVDGIGAEDDFFLAGGGSLQAVEMLAEVAEVFRVEITLGEFFRQPTVR